MTSGKMSAFKWESRWNQLKWQSSWIRGMNWHKTSPIAFVQLHQSWEIISTLTIVQIEPREIDSLNCWFHKRGWKLNNKGKQIDKSGPSCYLILGLYIFKNNTAQTGWSNLRDVHSCFPKKMYCLPSSEQGRLDDLRKIRLHSAAILHRLGASD